MKRLLGILMILILIAGVFVSCSQDKIEETFISGEELLDVSFGAASGRARALVVDTPTFNDGDYIWYYTAKKADTTGFKTGETLVKTPVKDPAAAQTVADRKGLSGAVISGLSQGYWDFGLYAYVPDTSKAVDYDYTSDYIAWQGSVTHFLLVKGAANVVDVTVSPSTQGKGWLVVDVAHIYIKDGSGALPKPVTDHPGTSLVYTVTPFGGTTPVDISEPIDAGAYLVKVVCTGSNIDYAEDSIVVNVYSGLTRTVSGWIGELTTSATFGDITGEIIEATTGSKSAEELEAMAEGGQSVAFVSEGTVPVTASLPASAAVDLLPTVDPGTDLDLTLTLNVKADAESTEQEVTTKSYDITLVQKLVETTESSSTTTVSNVTDPLIEYLTATLTIDKNLSAVSVKHSNVSMVDLAGATAPTDEQIEADAEAGYPGFYNYDSATGVLTLITKKFSPFQVSFTKPVSGIARVTRIVGELETTVADCKSLDDAFELALDGDTVVVLADTTRGATKTVSKEIGIKVVSHIKDVTDPLMLVGRGYEGTYNTDSQLLTIKKTPVTDAVARIDEGDDHLYFRTLQKAFDSAITGDTVVLIDNFEVPSPAEVDEGKNFVFDLNGYTLSAAVRVPGEHYTERHYYAIDNYGTITIKDSGSDGKIIARGIENLAGGTMTIKSGTFYSIDGNGGACVWNEGSLTIDGGSFIVDGGAPVTFDYGTGCIHSDEGSVLTINNATMISDDARCYAIIADGTTVIKNATVTATHGALAIDSGNAVIDGGSFFCTNFYGCWITNDGSDTSVTINGGSFEGSYGLYSSVDDGGQDESDIAILITGGTFIGRTKAAVINEQRTEYEFALTITGGFYSSDPRDYVAEGYGVVYDKETGLFKVVESWTKGVVPYEQASDLVINSAADLAKFAVSVTSAPDKSIWDGKTVTLDADIDLSGKAWEPIVNWSDDPTSYTSGLTFNGNGHTISGMNAVGKHDVGLFSTSCGVHVKNLTMTNSTVVGINRVGAIAGHGMCMYCDDCAVEDSFIMAYVENNDDGDKAGGIVGYFTCDVAPAQEIKPHVTNCTVTNSTIIGYRDIGCVIGYGNGAGNNPTLEGLVSEFNTLVNDRLNNYKHYTSNEQFDVGEIIGESNDITLSDCIISEVTINVLEPNQQN